MISIELYVTLMIAAVLLAVYGIMDLRNRFYANIAALFMSSMIAWWLSTVIGNGTLQTGVVVNQTSGLTTPIVIQDASLGWLLLVPAVAGMFGTMYLIYDAYSEAKRDKIAMEDM